MTTFSKVIYKDNPPSISEYMIYVTKHQMSTFYKSHELMCRYLLFEKSIKRILPESSTWTSEWSDETYILQQVEKTLDLDYHNAYGDFDKLIEMLSKMETGQSAVSEFLSVHNFSMELARAIWPEDTENAILKYFSYFYQRYGMSKKRGHEFFIQRSRTSIMNHWIYRQMQSWYETKAYPLSNTVRTKMLNLALGI